MVTAGVPINFTPETILSGSGISYSWPTTLGGDTAILTCPLDSNVIVIRNCSDEGSWLSIVDDGCTVNEQLDRIDNSFTNVKKHVQIIKYLSIMHIMCSLPVRHTGKL